MLSGKVEAMRDAEAVLRGAQAAERIQSRCDGV